MQHENPNEKNQHLKQQIFVLQIEKKRYELVILQGNCGIGI
jgi:hypothetical protein